MNGSVRKRGKSYQYRFHIRDPITNERKEISKGGFSSEAEAKKALKKAMAEVELGLYTSSSKFTFEQLTALWIEEKESSVRESTMYSYTRVLGARILPEFRKMDVKDIKPLHIHNFYQKLKKQGMSQRYISYVGVVLKAILEKGVEMEFIPSNPASKAKKPKMKKKKQLSWTKEDAITFLNAARLRSDYFLAYYLAFFTGMRIGEVLGLKWEDVDFENKIMHVKHTITLNKGEYVLGPVKTESSDRLIPISDSVIKELLNHKNHSQHTSETMVFQTRKGKIVWPYTLRYIMKRICEELDLPLIRFHDIRRTHTSILIDEGVSPKVVSQRLGHSDVSITLNIYTDVFDERQVEASDKIDEILNVVNSVVKEDS